jgi:hypothetical protein
MQRLRLKHTGSSNVALGQMLYFPRIFFQTAVRVCWGSAATP